MENKKAKALKKAHIAYHKLKKYNSTLKFPEDCDLYIGEDRSKDKFIYMCVLNGGKLHASGVSLKNRTTEQSEKRLIDAYKNYFS